jgi:hypothetical protein
MPGRIPMKVLDPRPLVQAKYMPGHIPMAWSKGACRKNVKLQLHAKAYTYERGVTLMSQVVYT